MCLSYAAFHHNPRVRGSSPCAATKLLLNFAYFYKPLWSLLWWISFYWSTRNCEIFVTRCDSIVTKFCLIKPKIDGSASVIGNVADPTRGAPPVLSVGTPSFLL